MDEPTMLTDDLIQKWIDISQGGRARFRSCESLPAGGYFCVFIADGKAGKARGRFQLFATLTAIVRCARAT